MKQNSEMAPVEEGFANNMPSEGKPTPETPQSNFEGVDRKEMSHESSNKGKVKENIYAKGKKV